MFFILTLCSVALLLVYQAVRIGVAAVLGSLGAPADIRLAIAFDPANASYYERMGRLDQSALDPGASASIPWFRRAVAIEPDSGLYWERLGQACEFAGERICAKGAFSRAIAIDAMNPRFLWLAANNDLLGGADDRAGGHFRSLLQMDPAYANSVFAVCLQAYGNPEFVGDQILGGDSAAPLKMAFVNFLARRNDFSLAERFWSELAVGQHKFGISQADPYLEKLIASGRIAEAVSVWRDLERWGILPAGNGGEGGNLVYNAGFERNPLNFGFGWRSSASGDSEVEFSDPSAHDGARCLRIDFVGGESHASEPVYQLIPVSGGQWYRLTAWVRPDAIASGSGVRLRVRDPFHSNCHPVETPSVAGTSAWHELSVTFSTCAETNLIRLSVWRPRDDGSAETVHGHFWLDDVTLEAQSRTHPAVTRSAMR
jgi:tetratricopeptide (TPR) repeat protein